MPAGEAMDGDRGTRTAASQPIIHYHRHNLKNRFELIKTLGEGTYGKVKLAIELDTGEKVAIKYIRKKKIQDDQDLNRIRREIKVMAKLRHPHIINVREVFENREKIVLVMDYASGGELYDYINSKKRLDDRDARRIFRQIVSAVHYCHENGVVHRDLKLENIVLDDNGNVRIADFGLSNFYGGNDLLTTYCGSPLYASPEIVNGQPYHGPEVDCWSLGVLLYTLVYGAMPFDGTDFKTLKKQISAGDYYEPSQLSDAANLIRQMLNPNPSKRATMEKICNYWWLNIGYSITPAGSVYPLPCQQTTLPSFSFLNFLSNGEGNVRGYGAKYSRSVGGKSDQPFTCKISLDVGVRSQTDLRSDDSDTLSEHSNEDTKKLFDAEKRPSRSILKKPGKFRGSDSGCGLEDTASLSCQDLNSPICDLHSQSDKYSASRPSANEVPDRFVSSKLNIELYSKQDSETKDHKFDSTRPYSGQNVPKEDSPALRCSCKISPCAKCVKESPEMLNLTEDSFTRVQRNASPSSLSEESKPPRRGILKRPKKTVLTAEEQRKRNSMGSQGSNSSADLLDFSYDSTEGEQLLSRYCSSNETSRTSSSCGSPVTLDKTTTCQMRFQSMSLSEEDLFSKSKAFDEPLFDIGEARDICRQALEICSIKGL